jgi:hypothetical protein
MYRFHSAEAGFGAEAAAYGSFEVSGLLLATIRAFPPLSAADNVGLEAPARGFPGELFEFRFIPDLSFARTSPWASHATRSRTNTHDSPSKAYALLTQQPDSTRGCAGFTAGALGKII